MWNRRGFLRSCMVGAGVLSGAAGGIQESILAAVRDTAGMSPEQAMKEIKIDVHESLQSDRRSLLLHVGFNNYDTQRSRIRSIIPPKAITKASAESLGLCFFFIHN